jgi:protein TonB
MQNINGDQMKSLWALILSICMLSLNCSNNLKTETPLKEGYIWSFNGDKPPQPVISVNLKNYFPEKAKKQKIKEYTVTFLCFVDEKGALNDYKIVSGEDNYDFNKAAVELIKTIRFLPGEKDNNKVKMAHYLPIKFILD